MLVARGDLRTSLVMTAGARRSPVVITMTTALTVMQGQLLIGLAIPKKGWKHLGMRTAFADWKPSQSNTEAWIWESFVLPRGATL